jgi:hypothetical protein
MQSVAPPSIRRSSPCRQAHGFPPERASPSQCLWVLSGLHCMLRLTFSRVDECCVDVFGGRILRGAWVCLVSWGALVCLELFISMWTVVRAWARTVRQTNLRGSIPAPRSRLRPPALRGVTTTSITTFPGGRRTACTTSCQGYRSPNQHQLTHPLGVTASPPHGSSPHDARIQAGTIHSPFPVILQALLRDTSRQRSGGLVWVCLFTYKGSNAPPDFSPGLRDQAILGSPRVTRGHHFGASPASPNYVPKVTPPTTKGTPENPSGSPHKTHAGAHIKSEKI